MIQKIRGTLSNPSSQRYRTLAFVVPIILLGFASAILVFDFLRGPERIFQLLEDKNVPEDAPWSKTPTFGFVVNLFIGQAASDINQIVVEDIKASIPGMPVGLLENDVCFSGIFFKHALIDKTYYAAGPSMLRKVTYDYFLDGTPDSPNIAFLNESWCSYEFKPPTSSSIKLFRTAPEDLENIFIPLQHNNKHLFPFDSISLEYPLLLWVQDRDNSVPETAFPVNVRIHANFPDWSEQIQIEDETVSINRTDETVSAKLINITLHRPFRQQFLTIILLLFMALFITTLLFVDDRGAALEISVGILFGLWGIGSVLLPVNVSTNNLVGLSLTILYIYFAAIAFYRFVAKPFLLSPATHMTNSNTFSQAPDGEKADD